MKKLIIKEIKINKFRNLRNIIILFDENYNEILGDNGLGKTAILDSIRFVLFNKNAFGKKFDNFLSISNDDTEKYPDIEISLSFNSNLIKLKTINNKWYINDIEQKNHDSFSQTLTNNLDNISVDILNIRSNPDLLEDTLVTKKEAKIELRNNIIAIANINLSNDKKISSEKLDILFRNINELLASKKDNNSEYRKTEQKIKTLEDVNPDIKDWTMSSLTDNDLLLCRIEEEIREYNIINDEIEKLNTLIKSINNKIITIKNNQDVPKLDKKINWFKIIFLSIITFGIFWVFFSRKKKIKSVTKDLINIDYELKNLYNKKNDYELNLKDLISKKDNIEIEKLFETKTQLKNNDSESLKTQIRKHLSLQEDLDGLRNNLEEIEQDLIKLNSEKINISKLVNDSVANYFPFEISLFSNNEEDVITIKENNVDLKFLNHANRKKIVYRINEFLKNKIDINSFILIDHLESINNIDFGSDAQIIACKVNSSKKLQLNGKNLY